MVCAYIDFPIYFGVVVAGDDDFSCFAEHDDAFFGGSCCVFAIGYLVFVFVCFTQVGELA